MSTFWTITWLLCVLISVCNGDRHERRQDALDSCTQTDLALLDACVASAIDEFLASLDASQTTSFDYGAVASSINSIAEELTSYGVTLSSLPDPATFTGAASTYSGPFVSDIVSSYSDYAATRTGMDESIFSFDTTSFQETKSTTDATTSSEVEVTVPLTVLESSPSQATTATPSETPASVSSVLKLPVGIPGLVVLAIFFGLML